MGDVIHVILLCTVRCGHQTPQLPKFRSLGGLRNINFILYVEEKSYTEFVLTGIEPEFSSWKASTSYPVTVFPILIVKENSMADVIKKCILIDQSHNLF